MIKMDFKGNITSEALPLFEGNNAYLKDFATSNDDSITYDYTYEEMKLIIDGEFHISDGSGEEITARKGDLIYFPKGSVITFRTDDFGLGYFVGQRGEDEA